MPTNSTISLDELVDDAMSFGNVAPTLDTSTGNVSPAISIANTVMQVLINGAPGSDGIPEPFNWKWNRINMPSFPIISYQQDYFIPNLVNLGWLESCWASQVNQTSLPKAIAQVEVHKDLQTTCDATGYAAKICWEQNSLLSTGIWGDSPQGPTAGQPSGQTSSFGPTLRGLQNPGPNVVYTNPIGQLVTPPNATTAITDPNGNLWCLTTFGTCGATQPNWPTNPLFPIFGSTTPITATTVTDGTCVWTAINPNGQGMRISPIPSQTGVVWVIQPVGQQRAKRFKTLGETLGVVPDDFEWAFKQGFFAECYHRSPDDKINRRFSGEQAMWFQALHGAQSQADREMDDTGFYPGQNIMETGFGISASNNPSRPYGMWSY
jgi:hypothetical protein